MIAALAGIALIAALLIALYVNGKAYTARVEQRWPALGHFIDIDGARIHIADGGDKNAPRVLLIHGATANLREVLNPLADLQRDHHVIAMDRPGYGFSSRLRNAQQIGAQARVAARVLEACGGRAVVLGHSLGAATALRLALDRPDLVTGLVLVAPAGHPYPGKNAWWVRLAAKPLIGPLFAATIVPFVAPMMLKAGIANTFAPSPVPESYEQDSGVGLALRPGAFLASARDVRATNSEFAAQAPRYPEILAPTIIVTAEKDRVVSPKIHARALAAELSTAEMVTAPGAGHMPHRVRPDLVVAAVRRVEALASAPAQS